MKANIHEKASPMLNRGGPFHGHELRLTIGMIVKNEEKTLEKCLNSLQPLLKAIPSELIITDTGSSDRTVKIAERFADQVIHFEWCDDFSAARNTGLQGARGEWFMFLDGDEWFEDTAELIDFFNSGECEKYNSASYIVRNYHDLDGKSYADFHASRLFRQYPDICFQGIVHENIIRVDPCKFFSAYVHHYGYVHQTKKSSLYKFDRNSNLLHQEIKEHPDDLKSYYQLAKEYFIIQEHDQAIDVIESGLAIKRVHPNKNLRLVLLHLLIKIYFIKNDFQKVLQQSDECINSELSGSIPLLDCLCFEQVAAFKLQDYHKAVEAGEQYRKLYKRYQAKELDMTALMMSDYSCIEDKNRDDVLRMTARSYIELDSMENAVALLKQVDLTLPNSISKTFTVYTAAADYFDDWTLLSEFYKDVLDLGDKDRIAVFVACMEGVFDTHPDEYVRLLHAITDIGSEDSYSLFCRLRLSENEGDHQSALLILDQLTYYDEELTSCYSDVLYYAMEEKINFQRNLERFDTDDLPLIVAAMQKRHHNLADLVTDYFKTYSYESPKGLYLSLCLFEQAILAKAEDKSDDDYLELLDRYVAMSVEYLQAVYQMDFLKENNSVLPRAFRFMYWMNEALTAKKLADNVMYLSNLKSALKAYPPLNYPVQLLLDRFEAEEQKKHSDATEFNALAAEIKKQVENMITQGRLQEARQIIPQLAALIPGDKDVQRFQRLTNAEPTMQEILSRLPQ